MSDKTIGEILKYLRQSNNLSQKDVADALNLSVSAISQYETGKRNLSANEILLFADYYKVSCDYLLGKEEVNTKDLIDKKLKLSYEITLTEYKDKSTLFEKFMIAIFYCSALVLLFLPKSVFLFSFALTIQLIFIIYYVSKSLFNSRHATKKRFTIPDDISVYYEYKYSNQEFLKLGPIKSVLLTTLVTLNIVTVILAVFTFKIYEEHTSYILLLMLIVAFTVSLGYETFYYAQKAELYKKIYYFEFGDYLRRTLATLLEITSYFLLFIYMLIYLDTGVITPLGTSFGLVLLLQLLFSHLYSSLIKNILRSYDLYAMLNDTLEVRKLS